MRNNAMMHTSLMPALAAFFAGPGARQVIPRAQAIRPILSLRFGKDKPRGVLAELREAGCHD
jgi:hypothetical protein